MTAIAHIHAREILDSRGFPTVEVEVVLTSGILGRASVPSGASTGIREALEKRDGDEHRFAGKGVLKAVDAVNHVINKALIQRSVYEQAEIDRIMCELDGTENKGHLGANAMLAVSLAVAHAAANSIHQQPLFRYLQQLSGTSVSSLPVPMMNIINGGAHADNSLDFQEFMILPVGFDHFQDAIRAGAEIFYALKTLLKQANFSTAVGDEGGFAPQLPSHESALEFIMRAIELAGYEIKKHIWLGLDVASSELFHEGKYHLARQKKIFSPQELVEYFEKLVNQFPIISIEDGMAEQDWQGWQLLTEQLGSRVQLVGDDLFVTNTELLSRGISEKIANAILIKPNQIGTLTETFSAIQMAKAANYRTIISHRSGETEDTTISDIGVGLACGQIKTGSLSRSDRIAKYNQLLRIADNHPTLRYEGINPFLNWLPQ